MVSLNPVLCQSSNLSQHTFKRRDLIPSQHSLLWQIDVGVVRTFTWDEAGKPSALGYWGPGDVVGQPLSRLNPYQIECLTNVEVSILPAHLWHQVLDTILLHVQQVEKLLSIIHCEPIHLRLMQLLVWLAQKFGREVDQGQLIDLPLTHQEIAEVIGTSRVSITRLLKQFEQDAIISRPYRNYIILHDRL